MSIGEFLTQYAISLEPIMLSIFLGLLVSLGILSYNKLVCGKIVRYLIENGIHTPDCAVTLKDAGLDGRRLLRHALRDGSILRKMVVCADESDEKTDPDAARFYLPEDKIDKAELSYDNNGTSFLTVLLTVFLFLIMMIAVAILAPNLVQMFQNMISMFTQA